MLTTALAERAPGMGEESQASTPEGDAVRANTYSLLASLLAAPPGSGLLAVLESMEPVRDADGQAMAPAWEALRLTGARASPEGLDDEYHALFIGVGRGELVPYGSWYMTGFMMDRPLAALRRDLAELGFERQEDVTEPEDHVAALLETMGMIVGAGESIAAQRRFFASHMEPWLKTFFVDLRDAPSARFYRAVAALGEQFVDFEQQYLNMVV